MKNEEISNDEIEKDCHFQLQRIHNQLKSKMNMIDLIKEVNSKIFEISNIWIDGDNYDYDFLNNSEYPFDLSINEISLKFNEWVSSSIKYLNDELKIL